MIPVKIECDCGQHYAFDVEPVNGAMPLAIACPGCGVDGTPAANDVIARTLTVPFVAAAPPAFTPPPPLTEPAGSLKISSPVHTESPVAPPPARPRGGPDASLLGIVSREQAEIEARAKVSWGDTSETVVKYLMMQGFSYQEASDLVNEMFKVRLAETRANGMRKILIGCGMMCVPLVALAYFTHIGIIPLKLMGLAIGIGLWGLFKAVTGAIMLVAPKTESGDVADQ